MDSTSEQLLDDICSSDPARVAAALQGAAPHRETLVTALLARLREASERPAAWDGGKGRPSPIFLLFLTAAWRETRAHPLLAALLRLPDKQCDAMLGDFITEGAHLVLADTWPGNLQAIEAIALDAAANPYARGTALNAAALLSVRGLVPREDALALVARVAASALDPTVENDVLTASGVVSAIMDLRAWELRGTVGTLFERDLVDYSWVGDEEEVLAELAPGTQLAPDSYRFPPPITDAWEAVRQWHFFAPLRPGRKQLFPRALPREDSDSPPPVLDLTPPVSTSWEPPQPYIAPFKPGRNDPCTCGSGRKYKKCCGA